MKLSSLTKAKTVVVLSLCLGVFRAVQLARKRLQKEPGDRQDGTARFREEHRGDDPKACVIGTRYAVVAGYIETRIGAARRLDLRVFQKISSDCGGCLQVSKQSFRFSKSEQGLNRRH
jgi:hypothetical protein